MKRCFRLFGCFSSPRPKSQGPKSFFHILALLVLNLHWCVTVETFCCLSSFQCDVFLLYDHREYRSHDSYLQSRICSFCPSVHTLMSNDLNNSFYFFQVTKFAQNKSPFRLTPRRKDRRAWETLASWTTRVKFSEVKGFKMEKSSQVTSEKVNGHHTDVVKCESCPN